MSIETSLAYITRRIPSFKGKAHLVSLLKKLFSAAPKPDQTRWITISDYDGDIRMKLDRLSYLGGSIYWLGKHHWREINYLKKNLKPDMVMIDVGANQGEFSLLAAKYLIKGRVIAFEPQNDMYQLLTGNVNLNKFKNITVFNFGLSDHEGTMKLYTVPEEVDKIGGNEGLFTAFPNDSRKQFVQQFELKKLAQVVQDEDIDKLDIIKIDVEGGELYVLKGAFNTLKKYKPKLIIEISEETFTSAGYGIEELLEYLKQFDYEPYEFCYSGRLKKIELDKIYKKNLCINALFM